VGAGARVSGEDRSASSGWSLAGLGALWAMTFLVWRTIAYAVLLRPGFLAGVPMPVVWIAWGVLTPLAVVAIFASLARSLLYPVRRSAVRLVFVAISVTGALASLLAHLPIEPHPFPDLGGFLVASIATLVYFVAAELGRGG
jgi:hypothetical protein